MRLSCAAGCVLLACTLGAACGGRSTDDSAIGNTTLAASVSQARRVPQSQSPYTVFDTLQVRPLSLSPSGRLLFAANTPDNRLEIFRVRHDRLEPVASVVVGLEPVSVAARTEHEVWVVNHLSDSVSIVDLHDLEAPRVARTLLVGDEPRDIVFAGVRHDRAFITTAHRGQNSPDDPDLFSPTGRADVWVFDADHLGSAPGGTRLTKLTLFADTPRALAVTPDAKTVYAAGFFSGNQTTSVSQDAVSTVYHGVMPGPASIDFAGNIIPQPTTGLVVRWKPGTDGSFHWIDPYGTVFDSYVRVSLPDTDVFAIDAAANPPRAIDSRTFAHVGTTLFNAAVNPRTGKVYVSNTDAHNDVRFEGHTPGFTSVVGNAVDSRITVIDPATKSVVAANLNPHLDHGRGTGDRSLSRAFPLDLAFSRDGKKLYVVAQGSSKLAVYDAALLEQGIAPPSADNQVLLSGGGPTGVVLEEKRSLAFVLTRFDNAISIVDLASNQEIAHERMFNPEPPSVTKGRQFLYDATLTSALGDQACASCHIGGDLDGLAWDLGNPGNLPLSITTLAHQESDIHTISQADIGALIGPQTAAYIFGSYQPLKGPMTTQSLRGLDNHGSMHWRGDRNGAVQQTGLPFVDGSGTPVVSAQPNSGIFDEFNAFKSFNVAFPGLVGNASEIGDVDMTDFTNFILQVTYPPNPLRNLDDSLTASQQAGQAFFFNKLDDGSEAPSDRFHNCNGCHVLDRSGNLGSTPHPGFFGSDGRISFENETQMFKVPHLRNAYQKVGMYASSLDAVHAAASTVPPLNPPMAGVRGFGYQHDGATATIEHFLSAVVFVQSTVTRNNTPPNPFGIPLFADPSDPTNPATGISQQGLDLRRQITDYLLAFDSNLFPIVGQQITLTERDDEDANARVSLLLAQAAANHCDVVAHARLFGREHGFAWSGGYWIPDSTWVPRLTDPQLRSLGGRNSGLTFLAVPPGEGWRVGIDRDVDGYADGDELAAGTSPTDPASHP